VAVTNDVFYLEAVQNCVLNLNVKYFLVLIIANMATIRNVLVVFVECNVLHVVHIVDRRIMEE
jgi:hypothetical protein